MDWETKGLGDQWIGRSMDWEIVNKNDLKQNLKQNPQYEGLNHNWSRP